MTTNHQPKISIEAVLQVSGRTWNQWFSELQKIEIEHLSHNQLCSKLEAEYQVDAWWAHLIAQEFERAMNIDPNRNSNGFDLSVTKTFSYPIKEVYSFTKEWLESQNRARCRKDVANKSLNCDWLTDNSEIEIKFKKKSAGKTQLVIRHHQLENEGDVDVMRNFWKENLEFMVESL
ncbi:MAG: hypothetical protein HN728_05275 [Flavobacteriales bacterium]|jgi:hypothetical protein|nr:hypothetical protein [Flavobacteriales bacterium]MBT7749232.1 hypothetical protein [Flavobacteriales bacterium]